MTLSSLASPAVRAGLALSLALLVVIAGPAHGSARGAPAGLSALERKLATSVDRHVPESLALLQRAVDINSGSLNLTGVRATAKLFQPEFEHLGFRTRWVDGTAWGRAGHLIAEHGKRGLGHLDRPNRTRPQTRRAHLGRDR